MTSEDVKYEKIQNKRLLDSMRRAKESRITIKDKQFLEKIQKNKDKTVEKRRIININF